MSDYTFPMTSRLIPGTNFVARTDMRSSDGSVRNYTLFSRDGVIGKVSWHPGSATRPRGYQEGHGCYRRDLPTWRNLAHAATVLAERASVTI